MITEAFPGSELLDAANSFIWISSNSCHFKGGRLPGCEIQLRTHYQGHLAQAMDSLVNRWGRAIRYGGEPVESEARDGSADGPTRRKQLWAQGDWRRTPLTCEGRDSLEKLRRLGADSSQIEELEREISVNIFGRQKRLTMCCGEFSVTQILELAVSWSK